MLSWKARARPKQLAPEEFTCWLVQTGRGWGKNETGSNTVIEKIKAGEWKHTALIGGSTPDVRDSMIDPERKNNGIFCHVTEDFFPKYEPSKRQIVWPNGAVCTAYSAEDADQLRGPNHDSYWADELAAWRPSQREQTWNNLQFTLRRGKSQGIITTTPRPFLLLKNIAKLPGTVVTRGSTYENIHNLSDSYINTIIKPYEGTSQGRQELLGELLEDNDAALFDISTIDKNRIISAEEIELNTIVIAVDPVGSKSGHGVGIVGAGKCGDYGYLLGDFSLESASPNDWAKRAIQAYDELDADYIVVERNYGGDMVANTIRLNCQILDHPPIRIKEVHATRGKAIRAEPVSMLAQQGRIKHVGQFNMLEDELFALENGQSDDRADAYVWCFTDLLVKNIRRMPIRSGDAKGIRRDRGPATTIVGSIWNRVW